ncbi:hypothetical protein VNO78_00678 [Psophocarpus tetragonolobus]|uniref:Uncharacterized protein n=1 Tax=Psophocarpus tetragonolobus TaxID=3891 RepID=A0AAN9T0T3_PSOTE
MSIVHGLIGFAQETRDNFHALKMLSPEALASNKPKNTTPPSAEGIVTKASQDGAKNQVSNDSSIPSSTEFQVSSGPANDGSAILVGDPMPYDEDSQIILDTPLPGMEAAKSNISSLSASTVTEAQLPNHGLRMFPNFSSSKILKNLTMVKSAYRTIPPGMFPPQLLLLNLSKNNISIIEGLCQLTRLRVLNLSYNRIRRIGHGLTSCSSLDELYLAGNKIRKVEGLHRLSKLTILDVCFNDISSAKCLGQLVANYNSLQAINLEGNPTQKSVGDEELKKYLQFILPNLVYYNGQAMKISTLEDAEEQLDENSHHKTTRKGSRGLVAAKKPSTTSTRASKNQTLKSSKLSKGKRDNKVLMPPTEAKVSQLYSDPCSLYDFTVSTGQTHELGSIGRVVDCSRYPPLITKFIPYPNSYRTINNAM